MKSGTKGTTKIKIYFKIVCFSMKLKGCIRYDVYLLNAYIKFEKKDKYAHLRGYIFSTFCHLPFFLFSKKSGVRMDKVAKSS